jgi:DNA-binding FadR family transcriptional regulator
MKLAGRVQFISEPLYIQVRAAILERIRSGVWKLGSAVPNEGDLAREFGVSSGTTRKALDRLESEGVLVRKQGRGTFVRPQPSWDDLPDSAKLFAAMTRCQPDKIPGCVAIYGEQGEIEACTPMMLREMAAGAIEIAAWLDREALLADGEVG